MITAILARIQECLTAHRQLSRLVNVSLKAYAGLMRYRLVRANYMTPQDAALGENQRRVLKSLVVRSRRENRLQTMHLTENLIEWSEKRGTDTSILQWDPEDG
jgi:hypothetical protein